MVAGLFLLASVASATAQSKGYRPPAPPPPPAPRPSAPVTSPRTSSLPPSKPQASAKSGSTSQGPNPSATASTPKGGTSRKSPDYAKLNASELQKVIGSDTKQIDSYRSKVNNPRANYPNWNSLSREQQGALMRQWNDEIRRHETSRASAQRMLSQKGR